jgi:vancomycin permeability regulator SanA
LAVAYEAYTIGKIEKILVSGDNSDAHYNEPVAMQKYLLDL